MIARPTVLPGPGFAAVRAAYDDSPLAHRDDGARIGGCNGKEPIPGWIRRLLVPARLGERCRRWKHPDGQPESQALQKLFHSTLSCSAAVDPSPTDAVKQSHCMASVPVGLARQLRYLLHSGH